jgi:hypothetical protein
MLMKLTPDKKMFLFPEISLGRCKRLSLYFARLSWTTTTETAVTTARTATAATAATAATPVTTSETTALS